MFHRNISVAFTNAKAEQETYVVFPNDFPNDFCHGYRGDTYAKSKANLYGSKSAPKLWYKCLHQFIVDLGFKSDLVSHWSSTSGLFIQIRVIAGNTYIVIIGIFVDDLLVTGNSVSEINEVREIVNQHYCLTDQGHQEYYLGVEVTQPDANTLMLHQAGYINKILDSYE